jgi:protein-S-isoprenylcysteine O-methyltransferase Ste14
MGITTLVGYFILAGFSFVEGRIRKGEEAKSYEPGEFDQRTTRTLGLAYLISSITLLASWGLNLIRIGILPTWLGWVGVFVALSGLSMRLWSNHVLGAFYTRTLKVVKDQTILRIGPYRLIRHPGYLGMILVWCGIAAGTDNWIVLLIVFAATILAYYYRIDIEEKMLSSTVPDYSDYQSHTWRLIPFIY